MRVPRRPRSPYDRRRGWFGRLSDPGSRPAVERVALVVEVAGEQLIMSSVEALALRVKYAGALDLAGTLAGPLVDQGGRAVRVRLIDLDNPNQPDLPW